MSKPKAQTIQQRFGFSDTELKTPKHDEIMLWLDDAIDWFAYQWVDYGITIESDMKCLIDKHNEGKRPEDYSYINIDDIKFRPKPAFIQRNKSWETPIVSHGYNSKYIVGFADMSFDFFDYELQIFGRERGYQEDADMFYREIKYKAYFEVKPKIDSLGELFRQIRMYQEYTNRMEDISSPIYGKWYVVCPDNRFSEQIKSQGIGFIKYEPIEQILQRSK